jgi:S-adenosylmethionine hydrolase
VPTPIITFTSDFGMRDWFVGVVHGVIHERCPDACIVDLSHAIEPGDLASAAFVLEAAAPDFPAGTVHLTVVDPGVGTARRALAVAAHGHVFVGPDNGVLEWALMDPHAIAHALNESKFFRHPVSRTFHGRDVFAPVAAHVALGVPIEKLGPRITDPVRLARPRLEPRDGGILGRVAYIDHFGNALTTITTESLEEAFPRVAEDQLWVEIVGRKIDGIARSYGDASIGTLVAIVGSSGRLEVAEVGGHAASRFGFGVGDPLWVRVRGRE